MPITYEIRIRGRASRRLLRPLLDEFTIEHDDNGDTRLVGDIVDPAQLHGVLARLTQLNAELISVVRTIPTDLPDPCGGIT
ncbi:MAG: hypothetical protein QOG99_3185 [Frankiales bacterium]|nr:hypothetical protein [Frankiales bacterium]